MARVLRSVHGNHDVAACQGALVRVKVRFLLKCTLGASGPEQLGVELSLAGEYDIASLDQADAGGESRVGGEVRGGGDS